MSKYGSNAPKNGSGASSRGSMPEAADPGQKMPLFEPKVQELLTVKEFCRAVRISERQFYRLRAAGNSPRLTKLGGRYLVGSDEMRRWLEANTERQYIDLY